MKNKIEFIAEIGMNHNGNFDLCFELIKQAKLAGADTVKFQLGWRDKPNEINQLDDKKISQLIEWTNYFDIDLLFSVITENAWKLIKPFNFNRFKIASRTVKYDIKLVKKILASNRKTLISLGMWNKKSLPFVKKKNIFYLWCLSKYPCHPKDLKNLPKNFIKSNYYGYSDHSIGIETSLLAVSRGAKIIEKHFTLDKSSTIIRDHSLSATPKEFRLMVNIGRDISKKINMGI